MESKNQRSVGELIRDLREAHRGMSVKNPHKELVGQAAFALVYLAKQVEFLRKAEPSDKQPERRIVLAGEGTV